VVIGRIIRDRTVREGRGAIPFEESVVLQNLDHNLHRFCISAGGRVVRILIAVRKARMKMRETDSISLAKKRGLDPEHYNQIGSHGTNNELHVDAAFLTHELESCQLTRRAGDRGSKGL